MNQDLRHVPYWIGVLWWAIKEAFEFLGLGHPFRLILTISIAISAIVVLGLLFGKEGEGQMGEEARWLLATGIVIASFVLLVVSFKLFTIPPRQLRLVEERHGQEITEATQKISELTDALEGARRTMLATPDQLLDSHLRNLQIRIADLVREDFVIRGRVIEDCYLYGPAMITLLNSNLLRCVFDGNRDITLVEVTQPRIQGAILFEQCTLNRCHFRRVAVIGQSELLNKLLANFQESMESIKSNVPMFDTEGSQPVTTSEAYPETGKGYPAG